MSYGTFPYYIRNIVKATYVPIFVWTQHKYIRNNLKETIVRASLVFRCDWGNIFWKFSPIIEKSKTGILFDFGLKIFSRVRGFLFYREMMKMILLLYVVKILSFIYTYVENILRIVFVYVALIFKKTTYLQNNSIIDRFITLFSKLLRKLLWW